MAELFQQSSDGDPHPVAKAYRAHGDLLRFIGTQRCAVPQQEVGPLVNDVFLSYLRHHARVRNVQAWLAAAMRHACADYWRGLGKFDLAEEALASSWNGGERDAVADRLDMRRVLARLPPRCRTTLLLRFCEGCSLRELAESLAVTTNNAKQIVHRCRAAARALFNEWQGRAE